MDLVDTNMDLGDALVVPIDPGAYSAIYIGIIAVALFVIMYVLFYRAQRRPTRRRNNMHGKK